VDLSCDIKLAHTRPSYTIMLSADVPNDQLPKRHRRLTIAYRSCFSICVTNFGLERSMVDPVKIFLSSSSIAMQNLVAISHTVCVCVGVPKNFGYAGALPLEWGMADHLKHAPSPYVTVSNLVALGQMVLTLGRGPKNLEMLGWGHG